MDYQKHLEIACRMELEVKNQIHTETCLQLEAENKRLRDSLQTIADIWKTPDPNLFEAVYKMRELALKALGITP